MLKYEMIMFWSEEDQSFVVEIPELPGCFADGPTPAKALEQAEIVANQWIETAKSLGREIPRPKGRLRFA